GELDVIRGHGGAWPVRTPYWALSYGPQIIKFTSNAMTDTATVGLWWDWNGDGYSELYMCPWTTHDSCSVLFGGPGPAAGPSWGGSYDFANMNTANNPVGTIIGYPYDGNNSAPNTSLYAMSLTGGDFNGDGTTDRAIMNRDWWDWFASHRSACSRSISSSAGR